MAHCRNSSGFVRSFAFPMENEARMKAANGIMNGSQPEGSLM